MADMIIDPYTWLDFKPTFGENGSRRNGALVPSWVGEHHRRLSAYKMLDSYARNAARFWMSGDMDEDELNSRREYGDDATLLGQIRTSLLGVDQSIVVGNTDEERNAGPAQSQRDRLRRWADQENFDLKLLEAEGHAVKLGDAVYVLGWDTDAGRPRLTVWDPGFYFPVLDPRQPTDQYPDRVHIAYEYEEIQADGSKRRYVRRITWELAEDVDDDTGEAEVFQYPWGDSTIACFMSDGTWRIDDVEGEVDTFSMEKVQWELVDNPEDDGDELVPCNQINIGIDYIPILHIPNMAAGAEHFGESSHSIVLQIIDDLISTDTDLQAASATTGSPPIAISGGVTPKNDDGTVTGYGPGQLLETGDGTATMIDTSRSLDALLKYAEHLLSRMSVNSRVPESLMGRIKPSEVPSGIALSLSFAPHTAMIVGEMRKIRAKKYRLLFRFVSRFYMAFGEGEDAWPDNEEIIDAELVFGTFLPADRKETVDLIVQLMNAKAISLVTAVRMLVEAGFPIEDAAKEVDAIVQNDFESAAEMLDATADVNAVRKRLGMEPLAADVLPADDPESERDPAPVPVADPNAGPNPAPPPGA